MTVSTQTTKASCNKSCNGSSSSSHSAKLSTEVPIFLRKTYHMIDTCDENIASWADDGSTFVVKQPETFEKEIIPQFFKHNKFSSFVRQLNFYGFRKIKFSDSILIDEDLEKKTANFWKFRHENFKRGREDLLMEIKRSHNSNTGAGVNGNGSGSYSGSSNIKGSINQAGNSSTLGDEKSAKVVSSHVLELKGELASLKDKIKEMTSNIDELTSLVKCVNLKDKDVAQQPSVVVPSAIAPVPSLDTMATAKYATVGGFKRKYPQECDDVVKSDPDVATGEMLDPVWSQQHSIKMDLDDESEMTDEAFVNELFHALDDVDDGNDDLEIIPPKLEWVPCENDADGSHNNAPDEKMMNKLSNALAVLPKDVQELLVDRIISTIHNADALKSYMENTRVVDKKEDVSLSSCRMSATSVSTSSLDLDSLATMTKFPMYMTNNNNNKEQNSDVDIPLAAAATLTAFMTQFSAAMKDKKKAVVNTSKTIPVIPIHA